MVCQHCRNTNSDLDSAVFLLMNKTGQSFDGRNMFLIGWMMLCMKDHYARFQLLLQVPQSKAVDWPFAAQHTLVLNACTKVSPCNMLRIDFFKIFMSFFHGICKKMKRKPLYTKIIYVHNSYSMWQQTTESQNCGSIFCDSEVLFRVAAQWNKLPSATKTGHYLRCFKIILTKFLVTLSFQSWICLLNVCLRVPCCFVVTFTLCYALLITVY